MLLFQELGRSILQCSIYSSQILPILGRYVIPITVNPFGAWVLKARHVRACLMKLRIEVPEECIEMPLQDIRGPRPSEEQKEFLVHITVTIAPVGLHMIINDGLI